MNMQKYTSKIFLIAVTLLFGSVAQASQPDLVAQLKPAVNAFMDDDFETGKSLAQAVIDEIVAQDPEYQFQGDMLQLIQSYAQDHKRLDSFLIREFAYWIHNPASDVNAKDKWHCSVLSIAAFAEFTEILAMLFTRQELILKGSERRHSILYESISESKYTIADFLVCHPNADLFETEKWYLLTISLESMLENHKAFFICHDEKKAMQRESLYTKIVQKQKLQKSLAEEQVEHS
jgi:hypothetical protein